jgi:hypothetical protein
MGMDGMRSALSHRSGQVDVDVPRIVVPCLDLDVFPRGADQGRGSGWSVD